MYVIMTKPRRKWLWFKAMKLVVEESVYMLALLSIQVAMSEEDTYRLCLSFHSTGQWTQCPRNMLHIADLKNYSQHKSWELRFIRWESLGLQAREAASQGTPRELLRGGGTGDWGRGGVGARLYRYFAAKGRFSGTWKDYRWIKKTRYPKLRNLALFYIWEDARVRAHRNHSLDMHLSYLGPVPCVLTSWVSSGLTMGSGCSLMVGRWHLFLPEFPRGSPAHRHWCLHGCNHWWLWHPLFSDMVGNIPFINM